MLIKLSTAEQKLAIHLGEARYKGARKRGVEDKQKGNQDKITMDAKGVGAEIAFCKMMNIYPDMEIGVTDYADAWTRGKMGAVDVKTTRHPKGRLLVSRHKINAVMPDSYALMICEWPNYRFVGWATADELTDEKNLFFDDKKSFALEQSQLRIET